MVDLMSGPQVSFGIFVFFGKNKLIPYYTIKYPWIGRSEVT